MRERVQRAAAQVERAVRDEFVHVVRSIARCGWVDSSTGIASLTEPAEGGRLLVADAAASWEDLQPYELETVLPPGAGTDAWPSPYDHLPVLHAARYDISCVLEVHPPAAMTVCLLEPGFEPRLSRDALRFLDHRHAVVPIEWAVQPNAWLPVALGALHKGARVVFLAGRSVLVAAESPAVAWDDLRRLESACQLQLRLLSAGGRLRAVSRPVAAAVADQFDRGLVGGRRRLGGGLRLASEID